MAVDDGFRGHDLGSVLIEEAIATCLRLGASIGFVALLVDAKTDRLVEYYVARGFSRLPDAAHKLFVMQSSMAQILSG
jgi:GNAT superfamily N-acetyltransferase